jgi:predicted Zn-dependent peptidase
MLFKGTKKRSSLQIARELEMLGGSINAFTSRENTCFYSRILSSHLPKAMEILGDILNNSVFKRGDLKKEKLVIQEEIKVVSDTFSDLVHDLFSEQMWNSHPLGQPIMGNSDTVSSFTRTAVLDFMNDHYQGSNIVIAAAGDVSHRKIVELTRKYFKWPSADYKKSDVQPQRSQPSFKAFPNRTAQTQVCLGFPGIGFNDPSRYAMSSANAILSAGMSSRLFQNIREKSGYCYTISSFMELFRDAGIFCVYFGADKKYVTKATNLVLKELHRLRNQLLTRSELSQIKEQLKGGLMLSQESTYNRMNRIARQELFMGDYITLDETCRQFDRVTARQIRDVVNRIIDPNHLTYCTLGPTAQREFNNIKWSVL